MRSCPTGRFYFQLGRQTLYKGETDLQLCSDSPQLVAPGPPVWQQSSADSIQRVIRSRWSGRDRLTWQLHSRCAPRKAVIRVLLGEGGTPVLDTSHHYTLTSPSGRAISLVPLSNAKHSRVLILRDAKAKIDVQGIFYMPHNRMTCVPTISASRKSIDSSRDRVREY
ncbi:hypothetical protein TNCV_521871 [Trichonephila clavipes]|nr:hypothetical protein TNCV_521871 [Trichonephila clavipes]